MIRINQYLCRESVSHEVSLNIWPTMQVGPLGRVIRLHQVGSQGGLNRDISVAKTGTLNYSKNRPKQSQTGELFVAG